MKKVKALEYTFNTITDLNHTIGLLSWDQEVNMPRHGAEMRAQQMATLTKLHHEYLTSDTVGRLLEEATTELNGTAPDSYIASLVRVAQRDYDQATKVPAELVAELTRARAIAHSEWAKARANNDYKYFKPYLANILDLTIQVAEHLGYEEHIYDALLDRFEPGMKTTEVKTILNNLRAELVPVVQAIADNQDAVDASILEGEFSIESQRDFSLQVAQAMGFDFDRGRLDVAVHPFAIGFGTSDVRITTRYETDLFGSALFSVLHEVGHGLYEQGFSDKFSRTPLADATSLGVHESQSRLWENQLGHSLPFWQYFFPKLQLAYPQQFGRIKLDQFYRAINQVKPSFIRVDADEVTYNLHILIRFELEVGLLTGEVNLDELPALWDAKMEAYLGIRPPNYALGVLQDVHWSSGLIGYFPTYSIGNLMSAQLYEAMLRDHPDFPTKVAQGEFGDLLTWMRTHVHRYGRTYLPQELLEKATGERLQSHSYMNYIKNKYSEIYGF